MRYSIIVLSLLATAAFMSGCSGPETWDKDAWQRAEVHTPARDLAYCVAEVNGGNVTRPSPGVYRISVLGGMAGPMPELSRADFRDVGKGVTEVTTYGIGNWFKDIPPHSQQIMAAVSQCRGK